MPFDLFMVIGIVVLGLAFPAIFKAVSDGHTPRRAVATALVGVIFVGAAVVLKPGGYRIEEIPAAFVNVVGYYLH
jgi:hypothetical protein